MGQIYLQFDNTLKFNEIVIPLTNSSVQESGTDYVYNKTGRQQTSVYGILTPLISINSIVVDFKDVEYFSLQSTKATPEVSFVVKDRNNLIKTLNAPTNDNNTLQIQILPPFDNAYRKINLNFYITNLSVHGNTISGSGRYKLNKLTNSQFKCFGNISTWDLLETIAKETGLGFATNVEYNDEDTRLVYCNNKSYLELLNSEIKYSKSSENFIYNYWVDFWNNINLVDIYDRYNTIEEDKDMMVWVSNQPHEMTEGVEVLPHQIPAVLNNHPVDSNSELHVESYEIVNKSRSQVTKGTDKVYSVFMADLDEYQDILVQNGDVKDKENIFVKYEYLGECYGDYNYLLAEKMRDSYLQKINTEAIKVTLKTPLLGLVRGEKVDFVWYINDSRYEQNLNTLKNLKKDGQQLVNDNIQLVKPMDDSLPAGEDKQDWGTGQFTIDKSVSGQYMITGQNIIYERGQWYYELILNRPPWHKPKLINEELIKQ